MGHLNSLFASTGANLNKPIFKSSNARRVDKDVIYNLKDPRYSVTLAVLADLIKATSS